MTFLDKDKRRPTLAEVGLEVTIGICAVSSPDNYFIAVSDRMLSYGDLFPATDDAAKKIHQIADHWYAMFAGDPVAYKAVIYKVITDLKSRCNDLGTVSAETVMQVSGDAYSSVFKKNFVDQHLKPLGYSSVEEFRVNGLGELGHEIYSDFLSKLSSLDLGLDLVIFGYDIERRPWIFEVQNPGRTIDKVIEGYTVVGSGYYMAVGSLRQKPLPQDFEDLIYRILEAKFVSETATGVGEKTTLITVNADGDIEQMDQRDVAKIKEVWSGTRKAPVPDDAMKVIDQSSAVRGIAGEGER